MHKKINVPNSSADAAEQLQLVDAGLSLLK